MEDHNTNARIAELRALTAMLDSINLQARREMEFGDGWLLDWSKPMNEYSGRIESILAASKKGYDHYEATKTRTLADGPHDHDHMEGEE